MKSKKLEKIDYFLIIFGLILVGLTIFLYFNPSMGGIFSLDYWKNSLSGSTDLLLGLIAVSIACVLGAIIPIPIPYIIVVALIAYNLWNVPEIAFISFVLVVIVSTITNLIGDVLDYVIGRSAAKLKEKSKNPAIKSKENQKKKSSEKNEDGRWARIIYSKPKLIPFIIFLFGCTPLPDSLLLMPLGVVKYDFKKILLWSGIGKLLMMLVVSIVGIVSFDALEAAFGGENWIVGMSVLWASYFLIILMTKLD